MCPLFFIFWPNHEPLENYKKCFLFHLKRSFRSQDIHIFVFLSFSLFLLVSHCFRGWSKINLKFYDVISCLNQNLTTYFVWYLNKNKRYDIETLSINRVLDKEHFCGKSYRKCEPKASPRPFLILVNNPKQSLHAINSFKNKIFWKRIIKNAWKSKLYFFFWTQSFLMDKIIKNKRGLELVTSHFSGYKTSSEKFLY